MLDTIDTTVIGKEEVTKVMKTYNSYIVFSTMNLVANNIIAAILNYSSEIIEASRKIMNI